MPLSAALGLFVSCPRGGGRAGPPESSGAVGFPSWEDAEIPWEVPRSTDAAASPPMPLTHTRVCLCAQVCGMGVHV